MGHSTGQSPKRALRPRHKYHAINGYSRCFVCKLQEREGEDDDISFKTRMPHRLRHVENLGYAQCDCMCAKTHIFATDASSLYLLCLHQAAIPPIPGLVRYAAILGRISLGDSASSRVLPSDEHEVCRIHTRLAIHTCHTEQALMYPRPRGKSDLPISVHGPLALLPYRPMGGMRVICTRAI